ncbi:enoyl-CoA hydratase-related protein [Streptomyces goshikiensis]
MADAVRERRWEWLAEAWTAGAEVPWHLGHPAGLRRVPLPPYPFRGERCWPGLWRAETASAAAVEAPAAVVAVQDPEPEPDPEPDHDQPACEVRRLPDGILLITLGRSTFTDELLEGFRAAMTEATADPSVSCVVITGSGDVFSMGATPEAMARLAAKQGTFADVSFLHELVLGCDKPVISAIQGHASGGGMVFGLYADIVVLAQEARYGAPFLSFGFTPGAGATFFVERKLGTTVAEELFYTGRTLTGAQLRARGASVDVRPRAEVLTAALGHAQSVARQSRAAASELKRELAGRTFAALSDVIERELRMHERVLGGEAVERVHIRLGHEPPTAAAPPRVEAAFAGGPAGEPAPATPAGPPPPTHATAHTPPRPSPPRPRRQQPRRTPLHRRPHRPPGPCPSPLPPPPHGRAACGCAWRGRAGCRCAACRTARRGRAVHRRRPPTAAPPAAAPGGATPPAAAPHAAPPAGAAPLAAAFAGAVPFTAAAPPRPCRSRPRLAGPCRL